MPVSDGYKYYKIQLHDLTESQKAQIQELSKVRRYVYNWGYEYIKQQYAEGKPFPKFIGLSNAFTALKKQPEYKWLNNYNITMCRYALKDVVAAYVNYFEKKCRAPKLKTKDRDCVRFATRPDRLSFKGSDGRYAYIPGVSKNRKDLIDCGNHIVPFGKVAKYADTRIKFDGLNYWLCLSVKVKTPIIIKPPISDNVIGIDVGIRKSATLSDGTIYDRPSKDKIKLLENRREKLQHAISKDQRRRLKESARTKVPYEDIQKSKRELKREYRFLKTMNKITNIHQTHYHKVAKDIAKKAPDSVVIENIPVMKMIRNNYFIRDDIYTARLGTLLHYIEYKCEEYGVRVIKADSRYKSSQICSNCGHIHKCGPGETYVCPNCGFEIDRDINASINLRRYGLEYMSNLMS